MSGKLESDFHDVAGQPAPQQVHADRYPKPAAQSTGTSAPNGPTTRRQLILSSLAAYFALTATTHAMAKTRRRLRHLGRARIAENLPSGLPDFRFSAFGARGDWDDTRGTGTDDRAAIQRSLDAAQQAGGGTVVGQRGNYRVDGPLEIHNNTTLVLEDGCFLWRNWVNDANDARLATLRNASCPQMRKFLVKSGSSAWETVDQNIHIRGPGGFKTAHRANLKAMAEKKFAGPHIAFVGVANFSIQELNCWRVARSYLMYIIGNDWQIDQVNYFDGQEVWEDGIHVIGGKNGRISNCHIESGDDSFAFGGNLNLPVSDIEVSDCTVVSNKGSAIAFVQNRDGITKAFGTPTEYVERITVRRLTGRAGVHRNGPIAFYTDPHSPDKIRDIDMSGLDITQGDRSGHDLVNAHGLIMYGGSRCKIQAVLRNCIKYIAYVTQGADQITLDLTVVAPQSTRSAAIELSNSGSVTVSGVLVCRGADAINATNVSDLELHDLTVTDIPSGHSVAGVNGRGTLKAQNVKGMRARGAAATSLFRSMSADAKISYQNCDARNVDKAVSPLNAGYRSGRGN